MSKHTPGPWRERGHAIVADSKHGTHSELEDYIFYGGFMVCESVKPENRSLIAAAPTMLEALRELVAAISEREADHGFEAGARLGAAWHAATDAIALAEGRNDAS